jgi:hypothetical protein
MKSHFEKWNISELPVPADKVIVEFADKLEGI